MFLTPETRVRDYEARGWWRGDSVDVLTQAAVARGGDAEALVDPPNRAALDGREPERLTWAQIGTRVDKLASALLGHGLRKDDVIVAQLPNSVDAVLLFLACARIGLILSPVAMPYRAHELDYIVGQAAPKAIVTLPTFGGHDHGGMMAALASAHGAKLLLLGNGTGDLRADIEVADPQVAADYAAQHPSAGGEVLALLWTSGTESRPKGVPRDHNHWTLNAEVVAEGGEMRAGDTLLNPFPLVNIGSIGGLVMPWLLLAAKLVLHHPFDLGIFLTQIATERVTSTIAPPAVLTGLLKQPQLLEQFDVSSLRAVSSGSAPLSPWLIEGWDARGVAIINFFGSSEGAGLYSGAGSVPDCANRARYFPRFGAEGQEWADKVHAVSESRLVDPATEEEITEPGRPGELRLGGASIFSEYWRNADGTAAAFDERGHFRTGDLFEIAGQGDRFYRFIGRSKEIIVRGGMNISPAELDDLLAGLPGSVEAATVGVPDDILGERIAVAVVAAPGADPQLADVSEFLAARDVAIFKRPERLVLVDKLPRNPMNKVVRAQLREMVLAKLA